MSCNGCRVLRKGCSEGCVLRHCLRCIDSPEAQAHATLFVTKFFGRAGLTGFINGVPENQRPALFQSLLYEACGRTVNPVYGAVGLLFSGNWAVCQAAVETVLRGGSPKPAAMDISTNHVKPNSTSALMDNPTGSLSTLDHPAGFNITTSAALINDFKHIQCLPAHESSLATSASSFKASSFPAAANHCVLDFSNYTASSSAEEMIKASHFNKRSRDNKREIIADEDSMLKRARSSFLNGSSAAAAVADPTDAVHLTAGRPSITAWIEGFNKANCRRIDSNDCMINYDVYAPAGRDNHLLLGAEIKNAPHGAGVANVSNGLSVQGTQHLQLVAPVARRVYIPSPIMKQDQNHGEVQMSKKRLSHESAAGGDDHQAQPRLRSGREECIPSLSCSVHQETMQDACGDAIDIKLNLGLQAQQGPQELCCDHGEFGNNNHPHDTRELIKHEEPHILLRMSSPSVNSEGSVNTVVGVLDRSSCTAFECPKDGLKLLNLLL